VLFSSRVRVRIRVRIRFSVWLVNCYAHVFVRLYVAIAIERHGFDIRSIQIAERNSMPTCETKK